VEEKRSGKGGYELKPPYQKLLRRNLEPLLSLVTNPRITPCRAYSLNAASDLLGPDKVRVSFLRRGADRRPPLLLVRVFPLRSPAIPLLSPQNVSFVNGVPFSSYAFHFRDISHRD
jgi:hypothetical protein